LPVKLPALNNTLESNDAEYKASPEKWIHELDVKMKDGQNHHIRVEYPIGDFNNPFDWDMADNKFRNVTAGFINKDEQEALLDKIHNLEKIDNINDLFKL
jgi:2-methylcitrate dehydratase PrpD